MPSTLYQGAQPALVITKDKDIVEWRVVVDVVVVEFMSVLPSDRIPEIEDAAGVDRKRKQRIEMNSDEREKLRVTTRALGTR